MKLIYIANVRMPTEKAHGIQIIKMCEAFANLGAVVELFAPRRFNSIKQDPFEYYNVNNNFKIRYLPRIHLTKFGKIGFLIESFTFSVSVFFHTFFIKNNKKVVVYSRDLLPAFFIGGMGYKIFYEALVGRDNSIFKLVKNNLTGIVALNKWIKEYISRKYINKDKILVAPNGVDLEEFKKLPIKKTCRSKIGIRKDIKLVLYSGHLYGWKGVDVLANTAQLLPKIMFGFLGGTNDDIKLFKEKYKHNKNIIMFGRKHHKDVAVYLKSADVLVLPNIATSKTSNYETSPIKLFEYMASGTPIVSSMLPSISEIVNNNDVKFFKSGSSVELKLAIESILSDNYLIGIMSKNAYSKVKEYTWNKRAGNILKFIKNNV
jgi:glycosyltransferase involved in cell wall biosynthesis